MSEQQEIITLRNATGDSLALTGPIYCAGHEGLGLAPVRRYTRAGPQQHGQTLGAAYLQPRVVTLQLQYRTVLEKELKAQRDLLEVMLNDLNHPVYLDVLYPTGQTRRLDCYYYDGALASRAGTDLWAWQTDAVQLIADDPTFYDPEPRSETWHAGPEYYYVGGAGLTIPWPVPMFVGPSSLLVDQVVPYEGTWESYPIWTVYGPASSVRLENLSTGEVIQFTGLGFVEPHDAWTIDLRYGYKTVRNLAGLDKIEFITDASDLATWHLAAHPEVAGGRNRLRLLASDCSDDTMIVLTYLLRYRGS